MVLVIGHRGARLLAVENTLTALRIAVDEGADGVEIDVQLSADGELFVFHDEDLRRLTGDPRRAASLPWRELRTLTQRQPGLGAAPIAHLAQVLEWSAQQPGWLNLELKCADVGRNRGGEALAQALARACSGLDTGRWVVSSFDREVLDHLSSAAPHLRRAALVDVGHGPWSGLLTAAPEPTLTASIAQVHPALPLITPERLAIWAALDWPVWTWTVNQPGQWEALLQTEGAEALTALITDDPGGLRRFQERHHLRRAAPGVQRGPEPPT